MAIQRHNGSGWAGPAKATYTLLPANVAPGAPRIWLRARSIWRVTGGGWQPTSGGYAAGADIAAIVAVTEQRSHTGGPELVDPVTGEANIYWQSYVDVTAGASCYCYALWKYEVGGPSGVWEFMGSLNINPHATRRYPIPSESQGRNPIRWCATAWDTPAIHENWIPPGQQGFSRFAEG